MEIVRAAGVATALAAKSLNGSFSLSHTFWRNSMFSPPLSQRRAFSALMSPPSMAVVYEHHGPPDAVTRFVVISLTIFPSSFICCKCFYAVLLY